MRKIIFAIAISSLFVSTAIRADDSQTQANREMIQNHLSLAIEYFEGGRLETATDEATWVLRADPRNSSAHALMAAIQLQSKDFRAAEESFKMAIAGDERNADARNNYGLLLCQSGKYEPAMEQFGRALATPNYPRVAQTLVNAGICISNKGDDAAAEKYFLKAAEEDPMLLPAQFQLAKLYFKMGRLQDAAVSVNNLHRRSSPSSTTLYLQAQIEAARGNRQQAVSIVERLSQQYPNSPEARKASAEFKY